MLPLLSPKQTAGVEVPVTDKLRQLPGLTVTVVLSVHPFASVTVTVYSPALSPVIASVVSPLGDQEYV